MTSKDCVTHPQRMVDFITVIFVDIENDPEIDALAGNGRPFSAEASR